MAPLQKHRSGEVHIRAGWTFTKNDALANLGTVIGGILVSVPRSALPDLVLGLIISVVFVHGGIEIVRSAQSITSLESFSDDG